MIDFTVIANPGAAHQHSHGGAMAKGLARHGLNVHLQAGLRDVPSQRVVCWGWRNGLRLQQMGHEVLVMERGYLGDRFAWTSLGWNGLNNRAAFAQRDDGGRRFRKHFGKLMKPWSPGDRYVLLIGQVPGDMSLQGRSLAGWYAEQARSAGLHYGLPVRFRPHPLALERNQYQPVVGAEQILGSLQDALSGAAVVITFNSNTGVDALLAGKPTVATDPGSMAWGVAAPVIGDAPEPDRGAWLSRLAWCQWSIDEISSGEAWELVGSLSPQQRRAA